MKTSSWKQLIPVMFCFFTMGFVDLVGIASNYVQSDLSLSDSQANLFPSLVFFWFLLFSVPTGLLMNKIGRKKTVLISILVTALALIVPLFGEGYYVMLVAFSLLGIGNAIMQTSLNPLVTNLISGDKLASTLTFGQFVKAIASFLAPILAAWGATHFAGGLGWRTFLIIYATCSILALLLLGLTHITEEAPDRASGFVECIKLLGRPFILLCFLGIMCHVGIDVGTNTTAPKLLMARCGMGLNEASFATSLYFIFRTIGCFSGSFILRTINPRKFLAISVALMFIAMVLLFIGQTIVPLYIGIALIGFGNSNVFSIVFAKALTNAPSEKNAVSALMIMGLFGGTLFPLAMGYAADAIGQIGAVSVMTIGVIYLIAYTLTLKNR